MAAGRVRVIEEHLHHRRAAAQPAAGGPAKVRFTEEEKEAFYHDGFVILRGVVPRELTERARKLLNLQAAKKGGNRDMLAFARLAGHEAMTDLVQKSPLGELVRHEMGPFSPLVASQPTVLQPLPYDSPRDIPPGRRDAAGVPYGDIPFAEHGKPNLHLDGLWTGKTPTSQRELEGDGMPKDRRRYMGDESADVVDSNKTPLWFDKEKTLSIGHFTCFVGVALNDQTKGPLRGQFAVLRGGHHAVQALLRKQRDSGGPVGPEGVDWPRFVPIGEDSVAINFLPEAVRCQFPDNAVRSGGLTWPEPTPVLLGEGDAVIALHNTPHTGTVNCGPDPRMNVYFRIRRKRDDNPHEGERALGHGVSEHLDRTFGGSFLKYPPGYDPARESIARLCDHWRDWDGMRVVAARLAARSGA